VWGGTPSRLQLSDTQMPYYHGLLPAESGEGGNLLFGVLCLHQTLLYAHLFPGRNKFPNIKGWSGNRIRAYSNAIGRLRDTMFKLNRAAELLESARRGLQLDMLKKQSITVSELGRHQTAMQDIPIYVDSLLFYLRIFADTLARANLYLFPVGAERQMPFQSFRGQSKWFQQPDNTVDNEYAAILRDESEWFVLLAGHGNTKGLRDLIVHRMIRTQLFFPLSNASKRPVSAFFFGENDENFVDVLQSIEKIVGGLCSFLDCYVEHFAKAVNIQLGTTALRFDIPSLNFFAFEGELLSGWLYPRIDPSKLLSIGC
jgi:hypothetical protein